MTWLRKPARPSLRRGDRGLPRPPQLLPRQALHHATSTRCCGTTSTRAAWSRSRAPRRCSPAAPTGASTARWQAAGFQVRPYHALVPSFGEWGFALAALRPFAAPTTVPPGLRYLDDGDARLAVRPRAGHGAAGRRRSTGSTTRRSSTTTRRSGGRGTDVSLSRRAALRGNRRPRGDGVHGAARRPHDRRSRSWAATRPAATASARASGRGRSASRTSRSPSSAPASPASPPPGRSSAPASATSCCSSSRTRPAAPRAPARAR